MIKLVRIYIPLRNQYFGLDGSSRLCVPWENLWAPALKEMKSSTAFILSKLLTDL